MRGSNNRLRMRRQLSYVGMIWRNAMLCIAHVSVSPADEIVDGSSS
jgi:hypothetical protein